MKEVIRRLKDNQFESPHHDALKMSLVTHADKVPAKVKADLKPIIGRYMSYVAESLERRQTG